MMRGEYGQRMRDEETDTRRKKCVKTPTENQKLIDRYSINSNSLEENQKLIRTMYTTVLLGSKPYCVEPDNGISTTNKNDM